MTKTLFTPGPLTTSVAVKQAMLRDLGSRENDFIHIVADVRSKLLTVAEVSDDTFTAVLLAGSGTSAVEAVVSTVTPPDGKWLVLANGTYGRRITDIMRLHDIEYRSMDVPEKASFDPQQVEAILKTDDKITHIAMVHCETSTGMLNDIEAVGVLAKRLNKKLFVDAMSSFGAIPVAPCYYDYLVASSNKCLQGVPGVSFVIAKKTALQAAQNLARTLSLDLYNQWCFMEDTGQFRFTPPVQVLLALDQALQELFDEGGVHGRRQRYQKNHQVLCEGMQRLGFAAYLPTSQQSHIITTFYLPATSSALCFDDFYHYLSSEGFVIYPGKLSEEETFRIGTIGDIDFRDVEKLLAAIEEYLNLECG